MLAFGRRVKRCAAAAWLALVPPVLVLVSGRRRRSEVLYRGYYCIAHPLPPSLPAHIPSRFHTLRCRDAACTLHTTTWPCGQCAHITHPPPVQRVDRASAVWCSTRRRGCAYQRYSDTRQRRVPVADGARRGLTARPTRPDRLDYRHSIKPQRACRPGGPWRAGCLVALRMLTSRLASHSTYIARPANHDSPREQPAACSQLAPRSPFGRDVATTTTRTHVTCQCHALALFAWAPGTVIARKSAHASIALALIPLGIALKRSLLPLRYGLQGYMNTLEPRILPPLVTFAERPSLQARRHTQTSAAHP